MPSAVFGGHFRGHNRGRLALSEDSFGRQQEGNNKEVAPAGPSNQGGLVGDCKRNPLNGELDFHDPLAKGQV